MLRILHVDRSEMFRKVMQELVYRCGHTIDAVATKSEAMARLASENIDLLVTALELDDGSAESLIRELAELGNRDIPTIVVTSTDSLEQRERFFALGVVDYMLKGEITEDRFRRYFDTLAAEDELSRFMRKLKVAVLDDSQVILKIVHRILSLNGFEKVELFEDPLTLLNSGKTFDLYITDIVLPNMSGEQVVSRIRRDNGDAIIISMSRFTGEKPLANILLAGADDYLHKPFDAAGLISRLKVNVRSYQYKKRLEQMAITDGLTGLYNHRYSFERLEEETAKAYRYGRHFSVLMMDVDNFKKINDTRGHRVGDDVLVSLARSIKSSLRSADVVGRYGGEEFLVLLPETDLDAARAAGNKIRSAIADLKIANPPLKVTISGGVAALQPKESFESLISRADANLYIAKKNGKNRIEG